MKAPKASDYPTLAAFFNALDAWAAQGDWVPANNRSETPIFTRSGKRLLYVYQPRTGNHAYLDMDTDLILSEEEANNALSMR